MNFDNDLIYFKADGTGTYHQTDGIEYPITWHYKKEKEDAIEFIIPQFRYNHDLLVTWENIEYDKNTVRYTEYYQHGNGVHSLGQGKRSAEGCSQAESYVTN
jgi:hypothetical protein